MCLLLTSSQQPHTHVSIVAQQPTRMQRHARVHCWSAPSQHASMSPLLVNNQQARTHVSIAGQHPVWPAHAHVSVVGQHPASTHTFLHLRSAPMVKFQGSCPIMGSLTTVTWPRALSLINLLWLGYQVVQFFLPRVGQSEPHRTEHELALGSKR